MRAKRTKQLGDSKADSRCAAGDERDLTFEEARSKNGGLFHDRRS
jgi:hypothetical protein